MKMERFQLEQQQQMAKWLHQNNTVIMFDLAIYVNA